jgi:Serine acetyltransferase, N-terminal
MKPRLICCSCLLLLRMLSTDYGITTTEGFPIGPAVIPERRRTIDITDSPNVVGVVSWNELEGIDVSDDGGDWWQSALSEQVYVSPLLWKGNNSEWKSFIHGLHTSVGGDENTGRNYNNYKDGNSVEVDDLWEQVKLEAIEALRNEPEAGPQLYQSILSQGSLLEAIVTIVARTYTHALHQSRSSRS